MNVLSLFDGISCTQVALQRIGIDVKNYYASEIDKHAIKITQKNFPDTIQLGDICTIEPQTLPKIDLLVCGSPCQDLSNANKYRNGFDGAKSRLFFEAVRLLKAIKPRWFLFENVVCRNEDKHTFEQHLGVKAVKINSALLSAQNRNRYYWSNINITQPNELNITLQSILEHGTPIKNKAKAKCLMARHGNASDSTVKRYFGKFSLQEIIVGNKQTYRSFQTENLSPYEMASLHEQSDPYQRIVRNKLKYRSLTPLEAERLQTLPDNYTYGISNTQRYKALGNAFTVDVIAHILKAI